MANPNNIIVYNDGTNKYTFEDLVKANPAKVPVISDSSSVQTDLLAALGSYSLTNVGGQTPPPGAATSSTPPSSINDLFGDFLAFYTGSGTGTQWTGFDDFLSAWTGFTLYVPPTGPSTEYGVSSTDIAPLYNYLYGLFLTRQGINVPNASGPGTINDWSLLVQGSGFPNSGGPFPPNPQASIADPLDPAYPFNQAMNAFFVNFDYSNSGDTASFATQLDAYLGVTATLQKSSVSSIIAANNSSIPSLPSYEDIYAAFGPSGNPQNPTFQQALQSFVDNMVGTYGYFDTSQFYNFWIQTVQRDNNTLNPYVTGVSSLDGNNSYKTLILNNLIQILIKIITTLQESSVAQANKLQFYTQYQNIYTQLMNEVPVFSIGGPFLGGSDSTSGTVRNTLNTSFNANVTDNLRSLRDIQQNNAQQMQTYINQSTDQVNQQSDMCSSFIQELSTLLTSIFR